MIQPPLQAGPMAAASNTNASGYGGVRNVVKEGMVFGVGSGTLYYLVEFVFRNENGRQIRN